MTVQRQSNHPIASMRTSLVAGAFIAATAASFALGAVLYGGGGSTTSESAGSPPVAQTRSLPGVGVLSTNEFVASAFAEHESYMEANFGQPWARPWNAPVDLAVAQGEHNALIDSELNVGRQTLDQSNNELVMARTQHDQLIDAGLNVGRVSVAESASFALSFARSQHDDLIDALALS